MQRGRLPWCRSRNVCVRGCQLPAVGGLNHINMFLLFAEEVTDQTHGASFSISAGTGRDGGRIPLCHSNTPLNGDSLEGSGSLLSFSLSLSFFLFFSPSAASLSVNPWETSTRSGSFEASQWPSWLRTAPSHLNH